MAITTNKCPECGGDRITSLGSNQYKCEYCGTSFTVKPEPSAPQTIQAEPTKTHCPYCGGEIILGAQKCQHCGEWIIRPAAPAVQPQQSIQQVKSSKSKTTAFLLAFLIGCLGVHEFYLGKKKFGFFYLIVWILTFWTVFMPWVLWGIATIEGICILCMSDEKFAETYN